MSEIRIRDLIRVARRLMVLQSTWCEGSMQSEGLAYSIAPGLQRIYEDRDELSQAIRRYHITFNTHPFMIGVIAGAVLKMEQDGVEHQKIASFIKVTMGPLAAFADPFFRGALAPFVGVLAAVLALQLGPIPGILSLLVLFNVVHLFVRFKGVIVGFREGEQAMISVASWIGPARTEIIKTATSVLAGGFLALLALKFESNFSNWAVLIVGTIGLGLALLLIKRRSLAVYITPLLITAALLVEVIL